MTKKTEVFCIDDYDEVALAESGYEFEAVTINGKKSGVFITVRGTESEAVQAKYMDYERKRAQEEWMTKRTGKIPPPQDPEEKKKEGIDQTIARIISWRGIYDKSGNEVKFSHNEALRVLKRFPSLAMQIIEASAEVSNFIKP